MAIPQSAHYIHWNYFLALENDLEKISRFIEFSPDNYGTYSIELAHLFLSASSEVDVLFKSICEIKKPDEARNNIHEYRAITQGNLKEIITERCYIPRYGLAMEPFINWDNNSDKNPDWWRSYNNVKHSRNTAFKEANLKNAINSIGALALLNLYYHYFIMPDAQAFSDTLIALQSGPKLIRFDEDHHLSLKKGSPK